MGKLDKLYEAISKAGMDPDGVRDLILAEAIEDGVVVSAGADGKGAGDIAAALMHVVNELLKGGADPITLRLVMQKAICFLDLKAAESLVEQAFGGDL